MEDKYCPLRHVHCLDAGCAWWNSSENACAISLLGSSVCCEKVWHTLTTEESSYPEMYKDVLVMDEYGKVNVATVDADFDWIISDGENSYRLPDRILKWREI